VENKTLQVAILSMYNNVPNQGMRSIKSIIERESGRFNDIQFEYKVFETRYLNEHPDINEFDVFISTGGPGDPFDGIGQAWEGNYFKMLDKIQFNNSQPGMSKKFIFSICHSFQLMCRYFSIATVNRRLKTSFGVFPCHFTDGGKKDPIFEGLQDPFHIVDSREWQCVAPDYDKIAKIGATILSLEKFRAHVNLEQALMSIRISPYWVGSQFHPEADPDGMRVYFAQEEKRNGAISQHGSEKFYAMLDHLEEPDHIWRTNHTILPNFLSHAVAELRPELISKR
jgi:GMP synthase-like glutamine amidotransferase